MPRQACALIIESDLFLRAPSVTAGDRADEASFEVWQPGGQRPVAMLRPAGPPPVSPDSERSGPMATQPSFDVLAGTQLNQLTGT